MSAAQVLNEVVKGVPPVPTQATLHATLRPREAVRMIEREMRSSALPFSPVTLPLLPRLELQVALDTL